MKKYINSEIKDINKKINNTPSSTDKQKLIKTKECLESLLTYNGENIYYLDKLNIDNCYDLIMELLDLYSHDKLLETELPIDYPNLITRKKIDKDSILSFINNIYKNELSEILKPNISNIVLFKQSILKNMLGKGSCIIYNNYYNGNSTILLKKYSNIKDYIIPTGKAVELIPGFEANNYYEKTRNYLMNLFMRYRALNVLSNTNYEKDATIYKLINYDNMVVSARVLKKMIKNQQDSDFEPELKIYLAEFLLEVLGNTLSNIDIYTLNDIIKKEFDTDMNNYINNLGLDNNQIINKVKTLSNKNYIQ